ncbi:unnamed protein product [Bursaphelenchus xylophilus]|uniref:(pine wood nematode) hypothetical protein n=1 Tax=Bursaphelenchus xylophilus TaxID=6326 RepID=A0A1I7SA71_BURXY|nr:unnamed protein product [Bursaphelenchus xylophilus]CAG9131865.1 unnamed protein product [Bursaphelenchus xylophilus]
MWDSLFIVMTEISLVFGALVYLYTQYREESLQLEPSPSFCQSAPPIQFESRKSSANLSSDALEEPSTTVNSLPLSREAATEMAENPVAAEVH